jgi:peptidoglycan/LPS O-acetylase OafA/YrhL
MQHRHHTERFHDLDALRAWAMLLGIVLHAAWMMTPVYWGAPIHDVDGGSVPQWIVWWIHMFRLQAFFLIAGLFAHLVYRRQKTWGFIKHRLSRIGIPLVVGCLIIYPVWFMQDAWAGQLQGRIQSNDGFLSVFYTQIARSYREVLDTFHLWFLYDLLLVYGLTLVVIFVFRYAIDRKNLLRGWIHRGFRWVMQSPYLLLFLVVPSALLLMQSKFWSGIEAYPVWFVPEWPGVVLYWFFFAVGWYLYAHLDLLAIVQRAWVQRLVVGTVVSIGMFAVYSAYVHENVTSFYPAVEAGDLRYGSLRSELLAARDRGPGNATYQVWSALTPEWQAFIANATDVNPDQQAGLALQLTERVIGGQEFNDLAAWNLSAYPELRSSLAEVGALERNRKVLEAALPGSIAPQITQLTSVKWAKFGYMLVYSVGMWLLVFGFVGFFHHFFQHPSPAMRYLADSSYWLYIVHLNILFQLGIWVADVPMSWPIKLTFYSVAAMTIMIPSYHWLVRSSFIGQVLNGRRYPYVPLFESPLFNWRKQAVGESTSESSPVVAHDHVPGQIAHHVARPHFDAENTVSDVTAGPTRSGLRAGGHRPTG